MHKVILNFVRLKILKTCYLIVLLGSLSAGSITVKSALVVFVLIAWYIHAATSNDYADRKIDAVNLKGAKDRPLVTKSITFKRLWTLHFIAGALSLVFSSYYGMQAVVLTAIILLFDYAYSFKPIRITDRGAVSQLTLPLAYVYYPFSLGYWSTTTSNSYPWLLVTGLYLGFVARLFLKDFRDVKGDCRFGKRTFLIRHGRKLTCQVSELFGLTSLLIVSFAINLSVGVILILIIGHVGALLLLIKLMNNGKIKMQIKLIAIIAKIANTSVVVLLTYYLSMVYINSSAFSTMLPAVVGLVLLYLIWKDYENGVKAKLA